MRAQASYSRHQLGRFLWLFTILFVASSITRAQSSTITARTPGAPANSYHLGDADTVNLFTGNLDYNLPLLEMGGRGESRAVLGVAIGGRITYREVPFQYPEGSLQHQYGFKAPNPLALVGSVVFDTSYIVTDQPCGIQYWTTNLATMTFVEPDGTEHSLRDTNFHGNSISICGPTGANLARVLRRPKSRKNHRSNRCN